MAENNEITLFVQGHGEELTKERVIVHGVTLMYFAGPMGQDGRMSYTKEGGQLI